MRLNFRRILAAESMLFELETSPQAPPEFVGEDGEVDETRNERRVRESVIDELCGLLDATGQINNRSRLYKDLHNREKRAVTAIGDGIAFPHVRTIQARSFVMAFARSTEGLPFYSLDGEPVHLFFSMVAPPYDDRLYLKVYKSLSSALLQPELRQMLMEAWTPNEVWQVLEPFQ